MKTLSLLVVLFCSFSVHATDYFCNYKATYGSENFETDFVVGIGREHYFRRGFNDGNHFFDFMIYEANGVLKFQYMEGFVNEENGHITTNNFSFGMNRAQELFTSSVNVCGNGKACWLLNCSKI